MGPKVTIDSAGLDEQGPRTDRGASPLRRSRRIGSTSWSTRNPWCTVWSASPTVRSRPGWRCPTCASPSPIASTYPHRLESGAKQARPRPPSGTLTFEAPDLVPVPRRCASPLRRSRYGQAGCRPCSMRRTRSRSRPSWRAGSGSRRSRRLVERVCELRRIRRWSPPKRPTTVEDALAVDHVARERAAALLD